MPVTQAMRFLSPGLVACALAACSPQADAPYETVEIHPYLEDAVLGDAKAPVTIVEYASTTCHGCYRLHTELMPDIKSTYIDTGKVKLVYRVLPTPPEDVSLAGAAIARCAGKDRFFEVIADLFENQPKILSAARTGSAGAEILKVGARHGLSRNEVRTCVADKTIHEYTIKVAKAAPEFVTHTPSLIVNGAYIEHNTRESVLAMIDSKVAEATAGHTAETSP
ncbi:MAG: thioredoxin domain-containing protein [Alphaproteobacteria bacterium]|nr:thioredoxin domain-containing protein [Alphaproteobacteria bacterium]